jgi:hypothetical protein
MVRDLLGMASVVSDLVVGDLTVIDVAVAPPCLISSHDISGVVSAGRIHNAIRIRSLVLRIINLLGLEHGPLILLSLSPQCWVVCHCSSVQIKTRRATNVLLPCNLALWATTLPSLAKSQTPAHYNAQSNFPTSFQDIET